MDFFSFFSLDGLHSEYIYLMTPSRVGYLNKSNMMISRTRSYVQPRKQHPTYWCKYVLSTLLFHIAIDFAIAFSQIVLPESLGYSGEGVELAE